MKIVVVEDQALLRESLTVALSMHGIAVVGHAHDADGAVALVNEVQPDLVLLDIQLGDDPGDTSGLAAAHTIRRQCPHIGLLVLSAHDEPAYLDRLMNLDAAKPRALGYLVKNRGGLGTLVTAITRVGNGEVAVDPVLVERLSQRRRADLTRQLTPHEQRILQLVAQGLSNYGIAQELRCQPSSVERHLTAITRTLNLPPLEDPKRREVNVRVMAVLAYLKAQPTTQL
jgi:DNA-binding NarL/FixJ family response regulator